MEPQIVLPNLPLLTKSDVCRTLPTSNRIGYAIFLLLALAVLDACRPHANPTPQLASGKSFVIPSDSAVVQFKEKPIPVWAQKKFSYKPSKDKLWDLVHTRLEIEPDWSKQQLPGLALLKLKPYYYPQNELVLDAKKFEIHSIGASFKGKSVYKNHSYDGQKIRLLLSRTFTQNEEIEVEIAYTAKPNEVEEIGSLAISGGKGLYFINADGSDSTKPRQLWTQGEPEAASCWFPTIDSPNERCTQEIWLTVDQSQKTLSNGLLSGSLQKPGNKRTDIWRMDLPHAPYLFMIAVGQFAVIKDRWRNVPLQYWVEPEYEPYAKMIFGQTPAMIEYFSRKLGYTFPWPKYDQIVVRDFVSGAMENTTASVFMEALQATDSELADKNWDDIIAHELFHQWFGNLVTLESWAQLPLNESFANYSQYLWDEYKYGLDEADYQAQKEKEQYFFEATRKQEPLIRFFHQKPDDMFDSHSYAKGGRILHMLRGWLGDEAFFDGLAFYLRQNAFQSVEIENLRLALEQVSGKDLKWFFDQWFHSPGHPDLEISHEVVGNQLELRVSQVQDLDHTPLYRLPVEIEIWTSSQCIRQQIEIAKQQDTIRIPFEGQFLSYLWDADARLLTQANINRSKAHWNTQFNFTTRGIHRLEALQALNRNFEESPIDASLLAKALNDNFWPVRKYALEFLASEPEQKKLAFLAQVKALAQNDEKTLVRAQAIKVLDGLSFPEKKQLLENALNVKSVAVSGAAFKAYVHENYPDSEQKIAELEKKPGDAYTSILAEYYATAARLEYYNWFEQKISRPGTSDTYAVILKFGQFLQGVQAANWVEKGIDFLKKAAIESQKTEVVVGAFQALRYLNTYPAAQEARKEIRKKHAEGDLGEILLYLD